MPSDENALPGLRKPSGAPKEPRSLPRGWEHRIEGRFRETAPEPPGEWTPTTASGGPPRTELPSWTCCDERTHPWMLAGESTATTSCSTR